MNALKVVAIVIGALMAFAVFILLLIIFLPATYRFTVAGKNEKTAFTARVRILGGFISAIGGLDAGSLEYSIRLIGIRIHKGSFKEEEMSDITGKKGRNGEAAGEPGDRQTANGESGKSEKDAAEVSESKTEKLKGRLQGWLDKAKEQWNTFKNIKYVLGAPVTTRAWQYLKVQLFRLLEHIKPVQVKGDVEFGTKDPALTAQIYGVSGHLAALIDDKLMIIPDLEASQEYITTNIIIKGRIFLCVVLLFICRVYGNRDIRRVLRYKRRNL
ncbi:MAG: hypothetical protein ACOX75_02750 [Lachnospiraceae bacterium]|jgi:hypothetical protein